MTKLIFELSQPCSEVEEDTMKTFPEIETMETDHELHISNEEQFDFRRKYYCFVSLVYDNNIITIIFLDFIDLKLIKMTKQ